MVVERLLIEWTWRERRTRLRRLMSKYRVSQRELGDVVGLSQSMMSMVMAGKRKLRPEHRKAIVRRYKWAVGLLPRSEDAV